MKKKLLTLFLTIAMFVCIIPQAVFAADKANAYVFACSDYQGRKGTTSVTDDESHVYSEGYVTAIIEKMKEAGYSNMNGFICCGDYTDPSIGSASNSSKGLESLKALVTKNYGACDMAFVQGNHDPKSTTGLSPDGANDTQNYGVFVIHHDDFPWGTEGNEANTKKVAENLKKYLKTKIDEKYTKPIFVVSHLPLHWNARKEPVYANYLFDVLNEAGKSGLNIIYLFGHNHSGNYDNYVGGSNIYLGKGDDIFVAQASEDNIKTEKLAFTYLNAGYTGYVNANVNGGQLTMTAFAIYDDYVQIERFSKDGGCKLKVAGTTHAGSSGVPFEANPLVYESPQTVRNSTVSDWGVEWVTATDKGFYNDGGKDVGVMRFLFSAEPAKGKIKETGIVYVNASGADVSATVNPTGTDNVFFGDITGIERGDDNIYGAKAYCVVENLFDSSETYTFWSDLIYSKPEFIKMISK